MDPHGMLTYGLKEWARMKPGIDILRDYAEGRHELKYSTSDFKEKYSRQLRSLRENLCEATITAFSDRLSVESWGEKSNLDSARKLGLDRLLDLVHDEAFRVGDAYVLVWPGKDGTPAAHFQPGDQIVPHVDPIDPTVLDFAVKIWVDEDYYARANIYTANECLRVYLPKRLSESFSISDISLDASKWAPYDLDGEPDIIGHSFGVVPVCWWANGATANGARGRSILVDVIPIQDILNKLVADMVVASESFSRPLLLLLNAERETDPFLSGGSLLDALSSDPDADITGIDITAGQIHAIDGKGPITVVNPPDLTKLLDAQDRAVMKIARVVGLPPFYISQTSGVIPSGESLKTLSMRMISRVARFQRASYPPLIGLAKLLGMVEPDIKWAPVVEMSEAEKIELALGKKSLGYSFEDILHSLGEADPVGVIARADAQKEITATDLARAYNTGQVSL